MIYALQSATFMGGWHLNSVSEMDQTPLQNNGTCRNSLEIQAPLEEPHPGDLCPKCGIGVLDYDGMLNLVCDRCGFVITGSFT